MFPSFPGQAKILASHGGQYVISTKQLIMPVSDVKLYGEKKEKTAKTHRFASSDRTENMSILRHALARARRGVLWDDLEVQARVIDRFNRLQW